MREGDRAVVGEMLDPGMLDSYVPRVVLRRLAERPHDAFEEIDGSIVFVDVSGFTNLSERLARKGREGAEHLVDAIGTCFASLLSVAYANGGGLLKFGGDALLLLFEGPQHVERACRSAVGMRHRLRDAGRIETAGAKVRLRMSVGVHSDRFHLFYVGASHEEFIISGPGATGVVAMEKAADAGEIVVSPQTASHLPARCLGAAKGPGWLLVQPPPGGDLLPAEGTWRPPLEKVANCLSTAVRAHALTGVAPPEHRMVTVAFLQFGGVDELISRAGPDAAAAALHQLVCDVQLAVDDQEVAFLASDVDADGGKLMLAAGAPRVIGDDEERMLLAVRQVMARERRLPVRVGVNRGAVFAGDVGPSYRRTYTVMGDATNLAARIMGKAPPGEIFATKALLERSATRFALVAHGPFAVKGKKLPVEAWSVGEAVGTRERGAAAQARLPLAGRARELTLLHEALERARGGHGRLVEIVGEPGCGKTRLIRELRERSGGELLCLRATCEAYTASTPYIAWRELLRELLGIGWEDPNEAVLTRLYARINRDAPDLLPWLPLAAIPLGADAPVTVEVEQLGDDFRNAKLHETVGRLLASQLNEPTLVEIADAHHMDAASAELLAAIAGNMANLPALVVVTRRDTPGGFEPPASPDVQRLDLAPLTFEETLALAEAATESDPLPPHLLKLAAERSGGNPEFLHDLLQAAATGGVDSLPDSIEAAAMVHVDRLDPSDRRLVRRASVLGRSFHTRYLADVLGDDTPLPDERAWERLSGLFADDGGGWLRFRSDVVREAAYAGLPFATRRRLHAVVGDHLEREAAGDAGDAAAVLSLHFRRADDHARAWRYARAAGDHAGARFAYADAATLYRRAIDAARALKAGPDELVAVWQSLGDARGHTGELDAAMEAFTAARRLCAGDPLREAQLLLRHALVAYDAHRIRPAVRWVRRGLRALEGVEGRPAAACRAHLLATLAGVRQRQGRAKDAIVECRRAIAEAQAAGEDAALAHSFYVLDWALFASGRPGEALHSERALEIYRRLGDLDRQAAVMNNLGGFAYWEGRWDDAVTLYRRGADASLQAGDVANAAFGDCNVGEVLSDQGRLDEAELRLRRALRVWRGTSYEGGAAFATATLGRVAVRAGRSQEGLKLLEDALTRFRALGAEHEAVLVEAFLAEAWAFAGHAELALETAERLVEASAGGPLPLLERIRGFALAQLGRHAAAAHAFDHSVTAARNRGEPFDVAVSLDALEELGRLLGEDEDPERAAERDAILERMDVVRVPPAPLTPADAAPAALADVG